MIFAEDISESVMSTLIYNNQKKIVEVCGITVPNYGDKGVMYLNQVSERTGAHNFGQFSDSKIENIDFEHIGKAVKVEIDYLETFLLGNKGKND